MESPSHHKTESQADEKTSLGNFPKIEFQVAEKTVSEPFTRSETQVHEEMAFELFPDFGAQLERPVSGVTSTTDPAERVLNLAQDHPNRSKDVPWYLPSIGSKLTLSARHLLETWGRVPAAKVEEHIYKIRDLAWKVFPWPCIGAFWFLDIAIQRHPDFQRLVAMLSDPEQADNCFVDLGTCLGQDLRALANEGVPVRKLYGADLLPEWEAMGYALFSDENRLGPGARYFIVGNIFATDEGDSLFKTREKWGVVHISMFLHIFDLENQERAAVQILKLLRRDVGAMVIGTTTGRLEAGILDSSKDPMCGVGETRPIWRHSRETMIEMWRKAAQEARVPVKIWADYDQDELREREERKKKGGKDWEMNELFAAGGDERRIFFRVERI